MSYVRARKPRGRRRMRLRTIEAECDDNAIGDDSTLADDCMRDDSEQADDSKRLKAKNIS